MAFPHRIARVSALVFCLVLTLLAWSCSSLSVVQTEDESDAAPRDADAWAAPTQLATARRTTDDEFDTGDGELKSPAKPAEAQRFFYEQRLGPKHEAYPLEQLQQALVEIQVREAIAPQRAGVSVAGLTSWTELGPGNIGGRTRAILIDPNDNNVLYAAGVSGGVWKSIDGGASWTPKDDLMLNLAVSCMAMDPTNPNVLYAGTGEGFYAVGMVRGLGIFKSTDAGETWSQLPGTVTGVPDDAFHYVNRLAISPNDTNRIYAATRTGVWRSPDAGATWSVVLSNPRWLAGPPASNGCLAGCLDLKIRHDSSPDVLFASFGSFQADGLFRSTDGGNTWTQMGTTSDLQVANQGRMEIAIAPSNNDVAYVSMADGSGLLIDVFRTSDGGNTWAATVDLGSLFGPWLLSNQAWATGCFAGSTYSQGWYDNIIAVDPLDESIVWVGGIDLFRSDDGGVTWGVADYPFIDRSDPNWSHADKHEITFDPSFNGTTNQIMYVGSDGGVYRTLNARAATSQENCPVGGTHDPLPVVTFESLNNSYGTIQFYHGAAAKDRVFYLGGTQDNGTNSVDSATALNGWDHILGADGGYVAIHPTDSNILYAEKQGWPRIYKSTDGGATFSLSVNGITDSDGLFITPVAMDPNDPDVLWTGGQRVWRTTDGAANWEVVSTNPFPMKEVSCFAVAPSDSNIVYAGYTNSSVRRTDNALDVSPTWVTAAMGLIGYVSSLAVDPADATVAYATISTFNQPHILKTENSGANWVSIDGIGFAGVPDTPVHSVAIRPCDNTMLYAGTELGIFASEDGGATWTPVNTGMAHTVVEALDFPDSNTLIAFTYGRGAFRADLEPCPGCLGDVTLDGYVDINDVFAVLGAWGSCPGCPEDLTGDTLVDINDIFALLGVWGACQ